MNQPLDLHNIPFHSFVLEASAGTGKTYSLVRIYLNWTLERGLDPLRLPVLTFTEDAAAEMRNRIGEELRGLLLQASERDPKRSRLIHLIEKLPTAPIGTIHSFCYKLLGRFPLELGVSFPLEMAPKNHRRQVFNDYLWREPVPWEAAQHVNWQRDRKNLEDFLFELYSQGWGQTRAGEVFPSEEFLELIPEDIYLWPARDPEGWGKLAKKESESDQSLGNYDLKRHSGKKAVEEEEKAKKRLLFLRGCRQYLEDFESHYAANGLDQGLVDFDDMIELVHQGICSPDSAFSERLKECYQGIIVDEFQDTNAPQWRIIQRGFYRQGLPVVIIGDPKQSIYLFRGGEPEVYFYAKKEILADAPAEQVRAFVLDQNFRSSPALIEGMNRWFTPVFDQGAMIFSPSKPPAEETGKISAAWEDPLEPPMEGPLVPQPSAGLDLPVDYTKDRWAEVVVNHIQDLMSRRLRYIPRHSKEETPVARTLHYGDIAILVQKHKHGNRLFDLCQKAGIPVRKTKGVNLFQTEEMLFFQRFLKILQNPRDEGLLAAFLIQGPLAVTWQGFYQLKEEENLGGCRMILAQARDRWAEEGVLMFWAVINSLQSELDRLKDPGPKDETGRGKTVEERLICRTGGERVLMNYRQILGLFIGKKNWRNPQEAVDYLQAEIRNRKEEEHPLHLERPGDTVQILTLHGSKGLEFPVVYLVPEFWHLPSGSFYYYYSHFGYGRDFWRGSKRAYEENREILKGEDQRLYYVGMTRAILKLVLPVTGNHRWRYFLEKALGQKKEWLNQAEKAGVRLRDAGTLNTEYPDFKHLPMESEETAEKLSLAAEQGFLNVESLSLEMARPAFTSYSGLVRKIHQGAPTDQLLGDLLSPNPPFPDLVEDGQDADTVSGEAVLPRGPQFGDFFHGLMEELNFSLWGKKQRRQAGLKLEEHWESVLDRVESRLWPRRGLGSDRQGRMSIEARQEVRKIVDRVLSTPLPEVTPGFALQDLEPFSCRAELPFLIRTQKLPDLPLLEEKLGIENGFLKGFIDYVFVVEDKVYFVDWKTNDLGPGDYDDALMKKEMESHHYTLQGRIYMLALSHWLGAAPEEEGKKLSMGGGFYFFLRGARGEEQDQIAKVGGEKGQRLGVVYLDYNEDLYSQWADLMIDGHGSKGPVSWQVSKGSSDRGAEG